MPQTNTCHIHDLLYVICTTCPCLLHHHYKSIAHSFGLVKTMIMFLSWHLVKFCQVWEFLSFKHHLSVFNRLQLLFCPSYDFVPYINFEHFSVIYMIVSLASMLELICLMKTLFAKCLLMLTAETVKICQLCLMIAIDL